VTGLTELRGVVTIAAVRLAGIRRARVAREKLRGMIRGLPRRIGAMAVQARRADVAGLARLGSRARLGAVVLLELRRVIRRHQPDEARTRPTTGPRGRHGVHHA